jgi:hypothetical protein
VRSVAEKVAESPDYAQRRTMFRGDATDDAASVGGGDGETRGVAPTGRSARILHWDPSRCTS